MKPRASGCSVATGKLSSERWAAMRQEEKNSRELSSSCGPEGDTRLGGAASAAFPKQGASGCHARLPVRFIGHRESSWHARAALQGKGTLSPGLHLHQNAT